MPNVVVHHFTDKFSMQSASLLLLLLAAVLLVLYREASSRQPTQRIYSKVLNLYRILETVLHQLDRTQRNAHLCHVKLTFSLTSSMYAGLEFLHYQSIAAFLNFIVIFQSTTGLRTILINLPKLKFHQLLSGPFPNFPFSNFPRKP